MKINRFDKTLLFAAMMIAIVMVGMSAIPVAQAAEQRSYSADLATLFNEHQRVLAMRDACITAQPENSADFGKAYQEWMARHVSIVDDLENRFAAMIKRSSRDQADYSKNYGKYQAEVLQMREDNKKALLANREKLAPQCAEFPAYLRHPKSDIPAMFPAEFKHVYRAR